MSKEKEINNGYVEVQNTYENKQIKIIDFIQSSFVGSRTVTVAKLEDGSYGLSVENTVSSGRALQSSMRLTEESLLALMSSCMLYFHHNDIDLEEKLQSIMTSEEAIIEY